ncbi:MAG: peptidoglycan-binding protein [Deltaproteobacteria bacterium]|nr:peptidoglycan-binding protein [Deltaproteobacteria bacterium]
MTLLVQGSTGQEVKNLQTALNYHLPNSLPPLVVDGVFGPKTRARVVQFQTTFRLKPDGIVGPVTHKALYSFVDCDHHLLTVNNDNKSLFQRANLFGVGDNPSPPSPFPFPPLPRLQLPFPRALPPLPPVLQPPRLEIDPRLLLLARITKFELEAGQQTTFKRDLNTGDVEREVGLFADLKGTVWSKPIGKNVELSAGGGMIVEKRLKPTPETETSVYVFGKAEVKNILKIDPLDLAKIAAEAQIAGKPGSKEPPDMSVTISAGPEVEVFNGKVTFGPGGYLEYKTNGKEHTLTPGVKITGTFHF